MFIQSTSLFQNNSVRFSRSQKEAFVKQMMRSQGDLSKWDKDAVAQLGGVVSGLGPKQIKALSKAGKEVFGERCGVFLLAADYRKTIDS